MAVQTPARIQVARSVRNGLIPNAIFETNLARSTNFTLECRRKELFRGLGDITAIPDGAGGSSRLRWRFAGHTGPLLDKLQVAFYMARQNTGDAVFSPKATLYITNADESTTYATGSMEFGAAVAATVTDVPSEFGFGIVDLDGVPANTDIYGKIEEDDEARIISCSVYEVALAQTSTAGYVYPTAVSTGAPIYDDRRQTLFENARDMWTDGAAHLFNWTVDNQASPATNATGTAKNIIDGTTTDDSGPVWTLDTTYCGTRQRSTTAPCVLAVYAKMSGSSDTGEVSLEAVTGSVGSSTISVSGSTAQWYTKVIDLPAALDDYYVTFANPDASGETLSVYAVSLFQVA